MDYKLIFNKYEKIISPCLYILNRFFRTKIMIKGKKNEILGLQWSRVKKTKISIVGNNNKVNIGKMTTLSNISINISGDNNVLFIGATNYLDGCSISIEDDKNLIQIGEHTYIYNNSDISTCEGSKVIIGEDCLLSSDIMIRTSDSHAIYDNSTNQRINLAKDIQVNNHVWIGNGCTILKGAHIPENCVIGSGTLYTNSSEAEKNSVVAGNPAKIIRRNIRWTRARTEGI